MLILISSGVIRNAKSGNFYTDVITALLKLKKSNHSIFLLSNQSRPVWLDDDFKFIGFHHCQSRQSGKIVKEIIGVNEKNGLQHSEVIILGASDEDFLMAVNSHTLLIRCGWASLGEKITKYGVPWPDPSTLPELVAFLANKEPWYFKSEDDFLDIYSLADAGTKYQTDSDLKRLIQRLQGCLKDGRPEYKSGFILHFLSSIYATQNFEDVGVWGFYPSSSSNNNNSEIMAEFCALARVIYKKHHKEPLFWRHTASVKRHIVGGDRADPRSQLETVHVNPFYKGKLKGKTIIVLDDYLTRGVSFGTSAALLKKAGAGKVIGISMGKFGNSALRYDINILDDPYAPITKWKEGSRLDMQGKTVAAANLEFLKKFRINS